MPTEMDSIILPVFRWAWLIPIIFLLIILATCIYNVFCHPLAKYPGPFWAKFGVYRATYHAWKGDAHLDAWRCHQIYGPIVRYAPDYLIFSRPDAVRDIYSVSSNVTKDPKYSVLGNDKLSIVTMIDKSEHLKRRKLVNGSFSGSNIKTFELSMRIYIERFLHAISPSKPETTRGTWGRAIDVSEWCCYLTCDVTTDFLFGLKYDLLRDSKWQHVVHDLESTNVRLYVLMHAHFLYLGRLDKWLFPESVRGSKAFMSFTNQLFKDFSRDRTSHHITPFSRFYEAKTKDGTPMMNQKQIYSEATNLIIAAQDTTSISLRAILFYLSRHPHAYKTLTSEIRTRFPQSDDDPITAEKLRPCTYLHACIMESMRMTPGIPGTTLFRHVKPGGQSIAGEAIPAGTNVAAGIYTVHHNEEIFPRPWEFIPERWIVGEQTSPEQLATRLRYWLPFSLGPRACIGRELAQTLICITVAEVIRRFDFRVPDTVEGGKGAGRPFGEEGRTSPGEFQVRDYIVGTGEGPVLEFRERG